MQPWYLGLLIVILRNKGGAYILAELVGSVFDRPFAAFRVIPYFAWTKLEIPDLHQLLNITENRLNKMHNADTVDPNKEEDPKINPLDDDWGQS